MKDPGHRPMNFLRRKKRSWWMTWSSPAHLFHISCCLLHFFCQHKIVRNCGLNWFEGTKAGWNSSAKQQHQEKDCDCQWQFYVSLKSMELQSQPDHIAGKSYWIFVEYNGKRKKLKTTAPTPAHLLPDWSTSFCLSYINCSWFLVFRIVSSIHGTPTAIRWDRKRQISEKYFAYLAMRVNLRQ